MQIKRIMCPKCKLVFDVENLKNEEVKKMPCPNCKAPLLIKFGSQNPVEAHTFYAPPKKSNADNVATVLVGGNNAATQLTVQPAKISSAKLSFGGVDYPLKEGVNIVGRKCSTSKATVPIETADRYMSRQHCSITIKTLPDGTKKAILSNYQNKNQTSVDGQKIENGDEIRLTDGNSITMGRTTVTYKIHSV